MAKPEPAAESPAAPAAEPERVPGSGKWRYPVIGLWMAFVGYLAGGMVAMLVAKVVSKMQGCTPPEGFPACNMDSFFMVGSAVGMITLPAIVLRIFWLNDRAARRGNR